MNETKDPSITLKIRRGEHCFVVVAPLDGTNKSVRFTSGHTRSELLMKIEELMIREGVLR